MDARSISLIVIGILGGAAVGYGIGFTFYGSRIKNLQSNLDTLNNEIFMLNRNNEDLLSEKNEFEDRSNKLESDFDKLEIDYNKSIRCLNELSQDVYALDNELEHYYCLEESFPVVLNRAEVSAIGPEVEELTNQSRDSWDAYERIHEYVTENIHHLPDIKLPYIIEYQNEEINDELFMVGFELGFIDNYISTPIDTLKNKRGDSEDQAILEYAMIQYYREEILENVQTLYLAYMNFTDGSSHLAIFMPASGENICILDPGGDYLTSYYVGITTTPIEKELYYYQLHWEKEIEDITLYNINIEYSTYLVSFKGSQDLLIEFFKH